MCRFFVIYLDLYIDKYPLYFEFKSINFQTMVTKTGDTEKKSGGWAPDKTDRKILGLLQDNAKLTIKEIGSRLHLTHTPVFERIKRLERSGVIKQYVAVVDRVKAGYHVVVFCSVSLDTHKAEFIKTFETQIQQLEEVRECYHVAGLNDYLLKVVVTDMEAYQQFLSKKLASLDHVGKVISSMVMSEIKHSYRMIP